MRYLLIASAVTLVITNIVYLYAYSFGICPEADYSCRIETNRLAEIFRFAPFFLVVTLLAALLPARYFTSWLRFARLAGPLAIVLVMLINAGWHHTSGGWLNLSGALDDEATWLVYTLFTIGSLWSLWRVRQEGRSVVQKT